jgi:hypothetical protein
VNARVSFLHAIGPLITLKSVAVEDTGARFS